MRTQPSDVHVHETNEFTDDRGYTDGVVPALHGWIGKYSNLLVKQSSISAMRTTIKTQQKATTQQVTPLPLLVEKDIRFWYVYSFWRIHR